MGGVSEYSDGVGAEALTAATGKSPSEWLAVLDAHDAAHLTHIEIARWVFEDYEHVGGWWAQGITVFYEQEQGMRLPGQQADGTFSVAVTRSIAAELGKALDVTVEAFSRFAGEPASLRSDARVPSARWKLGDGTSLLASVNPTKSGKAAITMTHSRIATADGADDAKRAFTVALDELAAAH